MAKLKLPFELEKPSANEYVTQADQIGYKGKPLVERLNSTFLSHDGEFIRAYVDSNMRLLWAIRTDGTVYYAAGMPPQIKALIDDLTARTPTYSESDEFICVTLDKDNQVIWGVRTDGTFYANEIDSPTIRRLAELINNCVSESELEAEISALRSDFDSEIESINARIPYKIKESYLEITLDRANKIIEATKTNGAKIIGMVESMGLVEQTRYSLAGDKVATENSEPNKEYVKLILSKNNRILFGIKKDGSLEVGEIKSPTIDWIISLIPTDEHILEVVGSGGTTDYQYTLPSYVFDIESGSRTGREFMTSLYPEGIVGENVKLLIDGGRKKILKGFKNAWSDSSHNVPLQQINFNYNIGGKGLETHSGTTKVFKANRSVAKNKSIRVLCIGDSLTEAAPAWPDVNYGGRGWPAAIKVFASKDNQDVGDINVLMVGTRNKIEETYSYNSQNINMRSFAEGRSGWTAYGYANYPIYVRVDGAATPADPSTFMGYKGMYYLCGLATKTLTGTSTPGQEWTDVPNGINGSNASQHQAVLVEICSTPVGKYKPDYCEALWNGLQVYTDFPDRESSYNGATSDAIMEDWLFNNSNGKLLFPDNPFYDYTTAQTEDVAFSLTAYLSRYKTLDDDGSTRLVVGSTAGTRVSNVTSYDVCTPTHVVVSLGTNDSWISVNSYSEIMMALLNACVINNTIKVGWHIKRANRVLDSQLWTDIGLFMEGFDSALYNKNKKMMQVIGTDLSISRQIYYIPSYYTHCNPMGIYGCSNEDAEKRFVSRSIVSTNDNLHGDAYGYCTIGHQVLAWIYYTLL